MFLLFSENFIVTSFQLLRKAIEILSVVSTCWQFHDCYSHVYFLSLYCFYTVVFYSLVTLVRVSRFGGLCRLPRYGLLIYKLTFTQVCPLSFFMKGEIQVIDNSFIRKEEKKPLICLVFKNCNTSLLRDNIHELFFLRLMLSSFEIFL